MKFYKFELINGYYVDDSGSNDFFLTQLSNIFDNGFGWINSVKNTLLDQNQHGITGNKSEVEINGNTIKIFPQFVDNPEEYEIEIDRYVLLDLINKWQEFAAKKTQEIYLVRYENGTLDVVDHLPKD